MPASALCEKGLPLYPDSADPHSFRMCFFLGPFSSTFLPQLFSLALTQFNLITAAASVRETATVLGLGCECEGRKVVILFFFARFASTHELVLFWGSAL